jgi:hypothetical protein
MNDMFPHLIGKAVTSNVLFEIKMQVADTTQDTVDDFVLYPVMDEMYDCIPGSGPFTQVWHG